MILFTTLTAEDRVLATHQTLTEARAFATFWNASDAPQPLLRPAHRIVSALRGTYDEKTRRLDSPIHARSDRFKTKKIVEVFSL